MQVCFFGICIFLPNQEQSEPQLLIGLYLIASLLLFVYDSYFIYMKHRILPLHSDRHGDNINVEENVPNNDEDIIGMSVFDTNELNVLFMKIMKSHLITIRQSTNCNRNRENTSLRIIILACSISKK